MVARRTSEIKDAEVPVASIDGRYVAYLRSIKGRSRIWLRSTNKTGLADVPLTPPELSVSEMSFGANDSLIFAAAEDHRPPGLFSVDLAGKSARCSWVKHAILLSLRTVIG